MFMLFSPLCGFQVMWVPLEVELPPPPKCGRRGGGGEFTPCLAENLSWLVGFCVWLRPIQTIGLSWVVGQWRVSRRLFSPGVWVVHLYKKLHAKAMVLKPCVFDGCAITRD
jgi:hypothetical protein